jgi:lipopolysaccharide assembly protein A
MRLLRALVAIFFVAAGIAVGALNPQAVLLDLGIVDIRSSLGLVVLVTLLLGAILGGLAITLSAVLPLKQRLRAQRRADAAAAIPAARS